MKFATVNARMQDKLFEAAYGEAWRKTLRHGFELWQSGKGGWAKLLPGTEPDWDFSDTFGRWGASVKLDDGWCGFTYPWPCQPDNTEEPCWDTWPN